MPSPFLTGFSTGVLRFVVADLVAEKEVGWKANELEVLNELLADVGLTELPACDGLEEDEEEGNIPVGTPRLRARE